MKMDADVFAITNLKDILIHNTNQLSYLNRIIFSIGSLKTKRASMI